MEILDKFNDSDFGKYLRAKNLKISQEALDEIGKEFEINLKKRDIEVLVDFGSLKQRIPQEIYNVLIEKNEFRYSAISEVFAQNIECELLTLENIEMLREMLELSEDKSLRLKSISSEMPDLSSLPVEKLFLFFGIATEQEFKKMPNVKELEIKFVEFHSISELENFESLNSLKITVHDQDPQLDMTGIDKFKKLTNFSITGQTLNQEDFENICTLENLYELGIGTAKNIYQGHNIEDYSSILNLSNLEKLGNNGDIYRFCHNFIIKNVDDFRKLIKFKLFQSNIYNTKITYIGDEELPADLLDDAYGIKLEIVSPMVIGEEFAKRYDGKFPGTLKIERDLYDDYTAPEVYAISKRMKEILEAVQENASEFEKVAFIYKTIGENCLYDRTGCMENSEYIEGREDITRSLKGGLLENKLVCVGFALVFKKLVEELGIDCLSISGSALGEDFETVLGGHAWNQVKIDGQWYNLDLTWDIRNIKDKTELSNFLISDEDFNKHHRAVSINGNIRNFYDGHNFNFLKYQNALCENDKTFECKESYNKEKIAEFFGTTKKALSSKEMIDDVAHSSIVTIDGIESNMELMASVESSKEITEEKMEERND